MSVYGAARVGELPGCVAPNAGSLRPPWQVPGPSSGCSRPAAAPRPDRPPAERCWGGSGGLPGLRVLSRNSPSTPSAMNRACQVHTTGFDLPDRRIDLGSAAAVGGGKDNLGAPHVLLWCAAIRNDRLKPEAICSRDVDDNSCSHNESLDCFTPGESTHWTG